MNNKDFSEELENEIAYSETDDVDEFDLGELDELDEIESDDADEIETEEPDEEEQRRYEARARRREQMRREKERQLRRRKMILFAVPAAGILLTALLVGIILSGRKEKDAKELAEQADLTQVSSTDITLDEDAIVVEGSEGTFEAADSDTDPNGTQGGEEQNLLGAEGNKLQIPDTVCYEATFGDQVDGFDEEEVNSSYGIILEVEKGQVLAANQAKTRISPASMTKILTVLVAAEFVEDLDDKVTITREETDYAFSHDCSAVNFDIGEVVTVRDLFYGTILPSGADAALALAKYVAGSHEAFVDLMNDKLKAMGLSGTTHFTNCVGLYDENHYSTVYDMAMILQAAVNNDLCREVLSAHTYTTSQTASHPDGITISNWFLRRIEDKDTHGEVLCAKTGFVVESRNCAASYALDHSGKGYICVTADAYNGWRCIYDHVALYQKYLK